MGSENQAAINVSIRREREYDGRFDCHLCEDLAQNAVVSFCGHLFCWRCLLQHLDHSLCCPVCNAQVSAKKVFPVYGGGTKEEEEAPLPTDGVPPKPRPRPPPVTVKLPKITEADPIPEKEEDRLVDRSSIDPAYLLERLTRGMAERLRMRMVEIERTRDPEIEFQQYYYSSAHEYIFRLD